MLLSSGFIKEFSFQMLPRIWYRVRLKLLKMLVMHKLVFKDFSALICIIFQDIEQNQAVKIAEALKVCQKDLSRIQY